MISEEMKRDPLEPDRGFGRRSNSSVLESFEGTPEDYQEHLKREGWNSEISEAPKDTYLEAIWEENGKFLSGTLFYYTATGSLMKTSEILYGWQESPPTILPSTWDKPARMLKIEPLWWRSSDSHTGAI